VAHPDATETAAFGPPREGEVWRRAGLE